MLPLLSCCCCFFTVTVAITVGVTVAVALDSTRIATLDFVMGRKKT